MIAYTVLINFQKDVPRLVELLGEAGVDLARRPPAPRLPLALEEEVPCLLERDCPVGVSLSEYDEDALRANLNCGDCKDTSHYKGERGWSQT